MRKQLVTPAAPESRITAATSHPAVPLTLVATPADHDSLAAALEHAGDAIEILDADFRILHVNPAFERITGYSRAEVIGKTPGSLLRSGHFDESYYEAIEHTVRAGRVWRGELITRRRDGEVRYQDATISPVMDSAGRITRFIAVKRDVTARRIAESALERARTLLADAIESISDGLAMFDVDDRLVLYNGRFLDAHPFLARDRSHKGLRFEELLRQGVDAGLFLDAFLQDDAQGWIDTRLHQHRRAGEQAIEQRLADGRWLRVTERRTTGGGIVGVWADISELKRREAAVIQAKEAAELADRAKSAFLAQMSHELRTPLNAVIGFAELLTRQIDGPIGSERYLRYARDIHISGEHLRDVIDDIIDLAGVESGNLDLAGDRVDVAELLEACTRLLREQAAELGLSIDVAIAPGLPPLHGDRRRLRQVLLNLLANAVKYSSAGGCIRVEAGRDEDGGLLLRVGDNGAGIGAADLARTLLPLTRTDRDILHHREGTGLGLPLARTLVEMHDGRFQVDSKSGAGTTVTCRFPPARVCAA